VLHVACKQRDLALVESLVQRSDIDLDAPDALGWYLHHPLPSSAACSPTARDALSLMHGAFHHHHQRRTPLHWLCHQALAAPIIDQAKKSWFDRYLPPTDQQGISNCYFSGPPHQTSAELVRTITLLATRANVNATNLDVRSPSLWATDTRVIGGSGLWSDQIPRVGVRAFVQGQTPLLVAAVTSFQETLGGTSTGKRRARSDEYLHQPFRSALTDPCACKGATSRTRARSTEKWRRSKVRSSV
jgi:hypothetical protein